MRPVDLIVAKRDGEALTLADYQAFVSGYLAGDGSVMEGQMAALLMAGMIRGFSTDEARSLTTVLLESGDQLDLSALDGPTIDKHSTGGVGDGTTLVVVPLLAAAGAQVVKLSGRGLGHTGGTLDKLEAIPGMRVQLSSDEIMRQADDIGCLVAAQTDRLVPADKALYALRDVTGTVASQALVASSIMSKKLASGADTIVLDVKTGGGAIMTARQDSRALAQLCVDIGNAAGRTTSALLTWMGTPLGTGIGNTLEIVEVVTALSSPPSGRFDETCMALAVQGLSLATGASADEAGQRLERVWRDGSALRRLQQMVAAQGGDPAVCEDPIAVLPTAPIFLEVCAPHAGVVADVPARPIGLLSMRLGAGRQHADDQIDPAVGVDLLVREGDPVETGQPMARIHARTATEAEGALGQMQSLITVADEGEAAPTVLETIR